MEYRKSSNGLIKWKIVEKKISLDLGQVRRMVHDKTEWLEFVRDDVWGLAQGMNPVFD